jgi:uncharacterized protein YjlB
MLLEFSVDAVVSAVAGIVVAFSRHHPVEASFTAVVGDVVVLDAGVLFGARSAEAGFHFVVFGHFPLSVEVDVFLERREVFETVAEVVQSGLVVLQHADHLRSYQGN